MLGASVPFSGWHIVTPAQFPSTCTEFLSCMEGGLLVVELGVLS